MTKRLVQITAVLLFLLLQNCRDQVEAPPEPVEFMKEIDFVDGSVDLSHVSVKSDGGLLLVGRFISNEGIVDPKILLYSTDAGGNLISKSTFKFDGYINHAGLSVCQLSPEKLLVVARNNPTDFKTARVVVFELDMNSKITTRATLETIGQADWARVIADGTGGFYLAVQSSKSISTSRVEFHSFIKRFDSSNTDVWSASIEDLFARELFRAANGDFLIAGSRYPGSNINDLDIACARIKEGGAVSWSVNLGDPTFDVGYSVCEDANGQVLTVGALSFDCNPVMFILDAEGKTKHQVLFDPSLFVDNSKILPVGDGEALVISLYKKASGKSVNLLKLNAKMQADWYQDLTEGLENATNVWLIDAIRHPGGGSVVVLLVDNKVMMYRLSVL